MKVDKNDTIYILLCKNHFNVREDIGLVKSLQNLNANLCGWSNELSSNEQLVYIANRLLTIFVKYDKEHSFDNISLELHKSILNGGISDVIKLYRSKIAFMKVNDLELYKLDESEIDNINLSISGVDTYNI